MLPETVKFGRVMPFKDKGNRSAKRLGAKVLNKNATRR